MQPREGRKRRIDFRPSFLYLKRAMKITTLILILVCVSFTAFAQAPTVEKAVAPAKASAPSTAPMDLAKAALAAHGGDKLKQMKSLVLKGSVGLMVNNQELPAAFSWAVSGERYLIEIISPLQQLKQVYDGQVMSSSLQGFSLPPLTSLGFPVLGKVGDAGYAVSVLGETAKKKRGFRVTTPEGFYTDFYIDEKTSQLKGYDSSFETGGRVITTSVEIDGHQTVEGIVVPVKYSQRFDMGPITAYANFKAKTVLVNSAIDDSVFAITK